MPKPPDLDKLRATLRQLRLDQAKQLYAELGAMIKELEQQAASPEPDATKGREVVEARHIGDRLYQLERIRCGKASCKCAGKNGKLHGPYWYAYWRDGGKLRSQYVGKRLKQIDS